MRFIIANKIVAKVKNGWKKLGPGFITGASDDDPSGIATYSQAGAKFGLDTLWTSWLTLPLMIVVLKMFSRLTLVSSRGLTKNLSLHYPKWIMYFVIFITLPAIVFNIGANLSGMADVAHLIFPFVSKNIYAFFFALLLVLFFIFFSYKRLSAVLKWLCLVLLVYIVVPFLVKQQWDEVIYATIVPTIVFDFSYLSILVAIIGTTISPYLFFWQSSMILEHKNHKKKSTQIETLVKEMNFDVNVGVIFSNLVMFFIILTSASVLYPAGIQDIETVAQAAKSLEPLAGEKAYFLFALGVIGTGLLSIPVLAGSIAYCFKEMYDFEGGMDSKWYEAKRFYAVGAGAITLGFLSSLSELTSIEALIYTAIVYGLTCPFIIALGLHMCNNKALMHEYKNNWKQNLGGGLALIFTMAAAALFVLNYFK